MEENPHFKELLQCLNEAGVEYLIVGGYAVMKYSEPRFTKDLDIWDDLVFCKSAIIRWSST